MLLKETRTGHMVEVTNLIDLINLNCSEVEGRYQEGEDLQDPRIYKKSELEFLSGEHLPRCWIDPHYRDKELSRHQ